MATLFSPFAHHTQRRPRLLLFAMKFSFVSLTAFAAVAFGQSTLTINTPYVSLTDINLDTTLIILATAPTLSSANLFSLLGLGELVRAPLSSCPRMFPDCEYQPLISWFVNSLFEVHIPLIPITCHFMSTVVSWAYKAFKVSY